MKPTKLIDKYGLAKYLAIRESRYRQCKCIKCDRPATMEGRCPYHGGATVLEVLHVLNISRTEFKELMDVTDRTVDNIHAGYRPLTALELIGLLNYSNIKHTRGIA